MVINGNWVVAMLMNEKVIEWLLGIIVCWGWILNDSNSYSWLSMVIDGYQWSSMVMDGYW